MKRFNGMEVNVVQLVFDKNNFWNVREREEVNKLTKELKMF